MMEIDEQRAVLDTISLVRIDSQNPGPREEECARWVGARLAQSGARPAVVPVSGGRDNLVVTITGRGERPRLVLLAHMDTVPIGTGWSVEPLGGVVRDGKLFGRGSADMKSGLACAIGLFDALSAARPPAGDVVLCATVDEEGPRMEGIHALVDAGAVGPEDQVLALEPTGLRLRIAQVGLRWLELVVDGRMAHAGRAHLGVDANEIAARIIVALRARVSELPQRDPILGRPLFTCGRINGGVATNVVAPQCRMELDLRLVPPLQDDEIVELVRKTATDVVSSFPGAKFSLEPLGVPRPPVRASEDAHIVRSLHTAFAQVTGQTLQSGGADGHEAYTDASMTATLTGNSSCTVFGPGSSDQAHTPDEFVEIDQIKTTCRVLGSLVETW